jgi:uncharacterized membrane protein YfcA
VILHDLGYGLLIGLIGGAASGLMGVSSGGFLVALAVMMLGLPQHVAQGVSLVAQVPPTSLSGVMQYRRSGHVVALRWLVLLSLGFVIGVVSGALLAGAIADRALRWAFVGYLVLLGLLSLARLRGSSDVAKHGEPVVLGGATLIGVGVVSGVSSGLLGIGGGLAITALLAAGLRVPQHVVQALALAVTTLPLTLPAAWVYAEQANGLPWWAIAGIIGGLWIGTAAGARLATLMSERSLRLMMPVCIFAMAGYMARRALV